MRLPFFVAVAAGLLVACSSETSGPPCDPDKYEPNDTPSSAKDLGSFTDDPDSDQSLELSITSGSDVDFFRLDVKDRGIGGDPVVTVNAPEGYEVTTWFSCLTGNPPSDFACSRGETVTEKDIRPTPGCKTIAPSGSVVSSTDCSGTSDDDGTVLVRVRRIDTGQTCSNYSIAVQVH